MTVKKFKQGKLAIVWFQFNQLFNFTENEWTLKKMSRDGRDFGSVSYLWVLLIHPVFGILPENQVTLIFEQFKMQKQDRKIG